MQIQEDIKIFNDGMDDDATLMHRIAGSDQRALRDLMRRHLSKTVRLAARIAGDNLAAEDIAQEAFIRVWKNAERWKDPAEAGAQFSTWLYRIVLNLCIDHKRKKKFVNIEDVAEPIDDRRTAEENIVAREKSTRVQEALGRLPERQRAALTLCFYEDYSNKEAADILGVGVKAVESLLVRARRALRDDLQQERSEP